MATLTITDLNNLPQYCYLEPGDTVRYSNTMQWDNLRTHFILWCNGPVNETLFDVGDKIHFSFDIEEWSRHYLAVHVRGTRVGVEGTEPGNVIWSYISGADYDPENVGLDANTKLVSNTPDTKILEVEFVEPCHSFHIDWSGVDRSGAGDQATGRFHFSYVTTEILPSGDDPYEEGGTSGTGGGTGNFDGTGDAIDFPSLPTLSAVDTGFITLFNPTIAQLGSLASYMWTGAFDVDNFKKLFADPMKAILGMSIVPVNVPSAGAAPVTVGNISTGVSMTKAASQYVAVDCGSINVNEYWGAYLDYAPYTECQIYLPYCGTHPLNVDDIMGKNVHVMYHVDVLSGSCCAYVKCGSSVMYTWVGQCSVSVPVSGTDWTSMINGALSIAASIGSMVASGGASAPMALGTMAQAAVNSFKPNVEKSGSMGGMGGMLGVQTPYLILTRPRQALPANQKHYTGYPSFITKQLGTLSGYTEVSEVHLENMTGTSGEIAEIEQLLKGGVIF